MVQHSWQYKVHKVYIQSIKCKEYTKYKVHKVYKVMYNVYNGKQSEQCYGSTQLTVDSSKCTRYKVYKVEWNTVNSTRTCYRAAAGSDLQKLLQAEKLLHPHAMPVLVYNMYTETSTAFNLIFISSLVLKMWMQIGIIRLKEPCNGHKIAMPGLFSRISSINQNADNNTYLATLVVTMVIYMQSAIRHKLSSNIANIN